MHLLPACPITQHKLPLFRAHGHLRRLSRIFMVQYRRREPASPARLPLNPGPVSTKRTRAWCAVLLGHGPSSAKGTRANSAVPLSRGINSATGGRVSNVAPLNYGTGACASRAAPLSHAPRSKEDVASARRLSKRTCSPSPLSDHVVAVGLRRERANYKTFPPGHEVAVGFEVWEGQH